MKKFAVSVLILTLCLICGVAAANTLVIPTGTKVIEEEAFWHESNLVNSFTFDQHSCAMGIGGGVGCVVLTMVFFAESY